MKSIMVIEEDNYSGKKETVEYSVNEASEGLWKNGKQICGTCQFNASSPKKFMRRLRRNLDEMTTIKMVRNSAQGW